METLKRREYFEGSSPISVLPRVPQPDFPEHSHDFDELVMVRSGCGLHYVDGRPFHVSKGSVFHIPAGQAHCFEQASGLCLTNVVFQPEQLQIARLQQYLPNYPEHGALPLNVSPAALCSFERLFDAIAHETQSAEPAAAQMAEALFSQLLILLWREHRRDLGGDDDYCRIAALIRHIEASLADEIDFDVLAARFSISPRTLHRRMLEVTGLAPAQYLNRVRLCHAMRMLLGSEASVTEIAFACGFNDSNYFSSRFNKAIGLTPCQYRKQLRASAC